MTSADGRGRTLYEILTGRNKRDMRPLELQYHNPLEAKVGCTISFEHEPEISGINFVIEGIVVYKTRVRNKDFFHTDYLLKGNSLDVDAPVRLRLRLIADETVENTLGHRIQLLYPYCEMEYDKDFHENVLGDPTGEFHVNQDDEGNELEEPRKYWRVEDVLDPYKARVTTLKDADGNGTIEDDELEHSNITYWDYHRNTEVDGQEVREFLTIEMTNDTGYFRFFRGTEVLASQISVY